MSGHLRLRAPACGHSLGAAKWLIGTAARRIFLRGAAGYAWGALWTHNARAAATDKVLELLIYTITKLNLKVEPYR